MARKTPESTREWMEYYQNLSEKNDRDYQMSGVSRYERNAYRYGKIADAFEALLYKQDARKANTTQRQNECNAVIEGLYKETYTRKEVVRMLEEAVFW